MELEDPLFELDADHLPVCFSVTTNDHFLLTLVPEAAPPKFTLSRLFLPLFTSAFDAASTSLIQLPPPTAPAELDSPVSSTTQAITSAMAEAMVPAPRHRRLVPFWDKQLKELLKKKNKARARGDLSTYNRLRRSFR
jgi:hypothetical protein